MEFKTNAEWREGVTRLAGALVDIDRSLPFGGLRELIFLVWRQLALAPGPIKHLYTRVSEAEILRRLEEQEAELTRRDLGLGTGALGDDAALVAELAWRLRGLELRFRDGDLGVRTGDPNDEWLIEVDGDTAFFVPLERGAWKQEHSARALARTSAALSEKPDLAAFDKRGLRYVRILPTTVEGAGVRLVRPERMRSKGRPMVFGAVLFPGLTFESTETATTFVINAVSSPELDATVAAACEAAHRDECLAAVFPELTIDQAQLARISDLLADKPWQDGECVWPTPTLVLAGSWHEQRTGGLRNVATILDGDGVELLRHDKLMGYTDPKGLHEPIQPGETLTVLVMPEGLFAFGICLDFCQQYFQSPYGDLDVDFVLVPSCGDDKTMLGHLRTAQDLLDGRRTRAFVVQQAYPPLPIGAGYVLPPLAKISGEGPADLVQGEAWSVFRA